MQTTVAGPHTPALYGRISRAPVSTITWVPRSTLKPGARTSGTIAGLEHIVVSIVEDGYTQPIVVSTDRTVIEGHARYLASSDPRIVALYGGLVPIVILRA